MGLKFKKLRHNLFSVMITEVKDVFSCSWGASAVLELVGFWSWTLSSQLLCVLSPCYIFPANGSSCQGYFHYRLVLSILNHNKIAVWLFISVTFAQSSARFFPLLCEIIILSCSLSTHLSPVRHWGCYEQSLYKFIIFIIYLFISWYLLRLFQYGAIQNNYKHS